MSGVRKLFVAAVLAALLFATSFALAQTNYLILSKAQGKGSINFVADVQRAGGIVTNTIEELGVVSAASSDPDFVKKVQALSAVQGVAADPEIRWVPIVKVGDAVEDPQTMGLNSEPYYNPYQWNIRAIRANLSAAAGYTGQGARVAVLDSGIVKRHPDIAANLNTTLSKSFVLTPGVDDQGNPLPAEPDFDAEPYLPGSDGYFNHGTHVAGIIAAPINNKGVQGVAPQAEIVAVKVLRTKTGSGSFSWIIAGLYYAAGPEVRADIINMSLGATFANGGPCEQQPCGIASPLLAALNRAINYAGRQGTLVVKSAGNEGVDLNSRLMSIPAQSGTGIAVAATGPVGFALGATNFDRPASYTNYGESVVNLAAPGGDFTLYPQPIYVYDMVLSPGGFNSTGTAFAYIFAAGTSMAAPHVSGVAALLVQKYGKGVLTPSQIARILEQTSVDIYKPGADPYGKGRVDALNPVTQ